MASPFLYFELRPHPDVQRWVQAYWGFDVQADEGPVRHTVWPDGCTSLLCRIRPGEPVRPVLSGPRADPLELDMVVGERYRGIRLEPWAAGALLGVEPEALRDRAGPASEVLDGLPPVLPPPHSAVRALEVMEEALLAAAPTAGAADAVVREAVERLNATAGAVPIGEVAAAVGLGARQFRRRFRAATGLAPKEYARVRRFRAAAGARLEVGGEWASLAVRFGFADQAHLVREVGRMTGLTPTALEARLQRIEHRDVRH